MLHLILINLAYDPRFSTPTDLLDHYFSLTGWAEGVAVAGAQVTVLQRFPQTATTTRQGVTYHFVPDRYGPNLNGSQQPWLLYRLAWAICRANRQARLPSVVHLNGLIYPVQARLLRWLLPKSCPLVVQHHAELMWPASRRWLQARLLAGVDGFLFAAQALGQAWVEAGVIASPAKIYEVMETSSILRYQDRSEARAATGLQGRPVVLWTGSLTPRKDPLTVLAGFEQALTDLPQARLYMAYLEDDLLPQIRARLAASERLSQAVTLLGRIDYAAIGPYYNSADIFVQGSRREGSGIALLDALACGVVPVVTDIPSFRALTNKGQVGALWPVGQPEAFTTALLHIAKQPLNPQSIQARHLFADRWSFAAIGRQALAVYQTMYDVRF